MFNFIKKAVLPVILAFILVFSLGCDNKNNNNNNNSNNGGGTPSVATYEIDSAEALDILSEIQTKLDDFVLKMNEKNILGDENITPSMISSLVTMLNDSYKATAIASEFDTTSFEVDKLYACKTATTDKYVKSTNLNDEKLNFEIVCVTPDQYFENYIFEIAVDKGEIKSLKLRSLLTTDTGTIIISMYETKIDFVNETFDVFYAKPIKHTWVSTEEWLELFLNEDNLVNIQWGFLYTAKVDLKATDENLAVVERYIDETTDTLETAVIEFSYINFYNNLAVLASNDTFGVITDIFVNLSNVSNVAYNDQSNNFSLAG